MIFLFNSPEEAANNTAGDTYSIFSHEDDAYDILYPNLLDIIRGSICDALCEVIDDV
jgi:hypothetical protein